MVWCGMKGRCYGVNNSAYRYYGLKGVTVCDEWINDFEAFEKWAFANGWKKGLHIDKDLICERDGISPKIYSPQTCIIVSKGVNSNITNIGKTRVGDDEASEICEAFSTGLYLQREIADYLNIAQGTVSNIIHGRGVYS